MDSEMVFCACQTPSKKYLSLSNELVILSLSKNGISDSKPHFNLMYRFVDAEVNEQDVRIIQDTARMTSIDAGSVRIKVPPKNHLRLYGESQQV